MYSAKNKRRIETSIQNRTRSRHTRDEQALLQSLALRATATVIIITDQNGRIEWVNPAFSILTGYTFEEAINKNPSELVKSGKHEPAFYKNMWEVILSGRVWQGEIINRRKDGSLYTEEMTITAVKNANGFIKHFIAVKQDITARKQIEAQLELALDKYKILFENFPLGITVADEAGNILETNPIAEKLLAVPVHEQVQRDIDGTEWRILRPDGTPMPPAEFASVRALKEKRVVENSEMGIVKPDATITWLSVTAAPLPAEGQGIVITYSDISTRKLAEDALRESEARYQTLVESSPDSIGVHSEGKVVYVNPAAVKLFHASCPEDLIGMPVIQLVHPDDRASVMERVRRSYENHQSADLLEEKFITLDGQAIDVEVTTTPIVHAGKPATQIIIRDITERKRSEEELRQSEAHYRLLADHMTDKVWLMDMNLKLTYASPSVEKRRGYTFEELRQLPLDQNLTPASLKQAMEVFSEEIPKAMADPAYSVERTLELEFYQKDGSTFLEENKLSIIRDENGNPVSILGEGRDVTERTRAEAALVKSEEKHKSMIANSWDTIGIIGLDGIMKYKSPNIERWFGWQPQDLVGTDGWLTVHPDDLDRIQKEFFTLSEKDNSMVTVVYRYKCKDGSYKPIELTAINLTHDPIINGVLLNYHDITERQRAEESTNQRVLELEAINRISLILHTASNKEEMLGSVLDEAMAILNISHGCIDLYDKSMGKMRRTIAHGWIAQMTEPPTDTYRISGSKAATNGGNLVSREFASDPRIRAEARAQIPPGWGGIGVPIRAAQQTLGVLFVSVPSERELDNNAIRLLKTMAEMTGAALLRLQLYEEARSRAEEFTSLYETSQALSSESELITILQNIVEHARALIHAASSAMYLYRAQGDELVLTVNTSSILALGTHLQKGEGAAGWVAQNRQPLRLDDYSTWEGRSPQYMENFIHAVLEVPMLYAGELIGVISVDETGESRRKFSDADERLLSLYASQAAGAIHSSRLHAETAQRLKHLQALRAVDQAISNSHDLRLTLNILLAQTMSQLNVDAADVFFLQPGSNFLELAAQRGFHTALLESFDLGDSVSGRAILEHQAIMALSSESDAIRTNSQFEKFWKAEGFACGWCVPLTVKGEVKGVLEVYFRTAFKPKAEWLEFLEALAGQAAIAINSAQLFENLQRFNQDLSQAYEATIEGWSRAMDLRDHETEGHTLRVTDLTMKLVRAMQFDESQMTAIRRGALLHDIGKLGVPDAILLKEGALTEEEWVSMRSHPQLAHDMLVPIAYLKDAIDIPYYHHEKWDGTGYPQGLKGDQIPLAARIFAIVDVWDALINDRAYRKKWTEQKTCQYIREQSGQHFDPQVVDIFLQVIECAAG